MTKCQGLEEVKKKNSHLCLFQRLLEVQGLQSHFHLWAIVPFFLHGQSSEYLKYLGTYFIGK